MPRFGGGRPGSISCVRQSFADELTTSELPSKYWRTWLGVASPLAPSPSRSRKPLPLTPASRQSASPLHDEGVRISIDDFGTGYTCWQHFPTFPSTSSKSISGLSYARQHPQTDDAIVRPSGARASVGPRSVAEGVETRDVFDRMCDYGFDLLQGTTSPNPA